MWDFTEFTNKELLEIKKACKVLKKYDLIDDDLVSEINHEIKKRK